MVTSRTDWLSEAWLRRLAGVAVFDRGRRYADAGRCRLLREGDAQSEWLVRGSDEYRVRLALSAHGLDAECSCPFAQDEAFCKHMVAAALHWRGSRGAAGQPSPAGPDAVRDFLLGRPATELVDRLQAWAAKDRVLAAELKAWRAEHEAGDATAWREALDAALRKTRSFYDVPDSGAYARRGAACLPVLRALVRNDPVAAQQACVLALQRIFAVGEHADDSNGSIGDLRHEVHDILLDALRAAQPQGPRALKWLRTWMALQDRDPWGSWDDEPMLEAAGAEVRGHYSRQVAKEWSAWLASARASTQPVAASDALRWKVRSRYIADRRHQGDSDAVLAAMRSDLRGAGDSIELAAELQRLGREREAVQALELAAKAFPGDHHIEDALLDHYARDGCVDDVLAIRRSQLERWPDVEHYEAVRAAAKAARRDADAYRVELHEWARAQERGAGGKRHDGRGIAADVRVLWLLHDRREQEALALARQPGTKLAEETLHAVAAAVARFDPAAADDLYRDIVQARMRVAQSPYAREIALVREWLAVLAPADAARRITVLKADYRAKRNFVAGLQALHGPWATIAPHSASTRP
jgi:uncharacterized Zn finger protein